MNTILRTIPRRASLVGLRFSSTQTHSAAHAAPNEAAAAGNVATEGQNGTYPSYKEWRVEVTQEQEQEALRRAEESVRQPSRA